MQDNDAVQGVFLTIALIGMWVSYICPGCDAIFFVSVVMAFVVGVVPRFNGASRPSR